MYRKYQINPIRYKEFDRVYNIMAKAEDCILLPIEERTFEVPVVNNKEGIKFGFGQANVWYANENNAKEFVDSVVEYIENYKGRKINKVYEEQELEEIIEINSEDIDDILNEIDSYIYENDDIKDYEKILKYIKLCNSIIKIEPMNEYVYFYRFILLILLYRFKKVINECEARLDTFKELKFEVENMLGFLYFCDNKIEKSIEKLINLANEYKRIEVYANLGDIYEYLEDYDEAKIWYNKILEIDNKKIETYFKIASIEYEVNNNYDIVLHYMDKIIDIDNKNIDALFLKAYILKDLGKKEEALKIVDKGLKIDSNNIKFKELKKEIEA